MAEKNGKAKIIIALVLIILILVVFLGLLAVSGFIDTFRLDTELINEKIVALSRESRDAIEAALAGGISLNQYPGYRNLAKRLFTAEKAVRRLEIIDVNGKPVFEQESQDYGDPVQTSDSFDDTQIKLAKSGYLTAENESSFLLTFPLNNQQEVVGDLHLIVAKSAAFQTVYENYFYIWLGCGGAVFLFALLVFLFLRSLILKIKVTISIIWCIFFLALGVSVIYTMYNLTTLKINEKLEITALSLEQKLNTALTENSGDSFLKTAGQTLNEYKKIDPDLSFIILMNSDLELAHADYEQGKAPLMNEEQYFMVKKELAAQTLSASSKLELLLGAEKSLIIKKLTNNLKNSSIVLLTSIVLSICLLNLAMAARRAKEMPAAESEQVKPSNLELVLPLLFLVIFAEGLLVSFLPLFLKGIVEQAHLDQSMTSFIFSAYFAAFWLSLLPARFLAKHGSLKALLVGGALLTASGYFGLAFYSEYLYLIISRGLSGLGQGIIFSALLTVYSQKYSTGEKDVKFNFTFWGYTGGMLLGTAFGALLTSYLGFHEIFIIAAGIGSLVFVYGLLFIPKMEKQEALPVSSFKNVLSTLGDGEFFKSFFFMGMIGRAIISGVICFSLPFLLKDKFSQVEIGQIIIVYFAFLFLSSLCFSKAIAGSKRIRAILFLASQLAGLALYVLGFMNWESLARLLPLPYDQTIFIIASLGLLGFAHGLLYIPASRHVLQTRSSSLWSESSLYSAYHFLESIGLLAGPLLMAQLLIYLDFNALALSWAGVVTFIAGVLFICGKFRPQVLKIKKFEEKLTQV
jgi:DHA1 family arabinose polymer transporter-like MFS transporter